MLGYATSEGERVVKNRYDAHFPGKVTSRVEQKSNVEEAQHVSREERLRLCEF
jgi:hypothetical protein